LSKALVGEATELDSPTVNERLITAFTDKELKITFEHVVNKRMNGLTYKERSEMLAGKYPARCIKTDIKAGSRNKKRGQQKPCWEEKRRKLKVCHVLLFFCTL
jgi:hypothetical protein